MSITLPGSEGRAKLNVGRQFPASFRMYFEMNRIFSVALVYCDKMSTVAFLGTKGEIIRMLCGQPVFLIVHISPPGVGEQI